MTQDDAPGRSAIGGIARSGSANLLAAGIGSVANLVIVVVISRGWPPALAGSFFAVTSVFLMTLSLVELGVDQGFVRFQARNIALGRLASNRRILRAGYLTVLLVSVLTGGVIATLSAPLGRLIADSATHHDATRMMQILAAALPVAAVYDLMLAQTRGHSNMRPTVLVERICRPTLQVVLLLVVVAVGETTPVLMAAAWVAPYGLGLLIMIAWTRRLAMPRVATPLEPAGGDVADFWRFTGPRGLARFFQVGLQRADVAIVAAVAGPAASALYTAATRFLVVGQVATQALQQVSEPHLARLLALQEQQAVRSVYHQLTLWSVALTWPLYLLVAVFAEPLLALVFGAGYGEGGVTLTVLALTMLFATAMGPVDVLLLMAGKSVLSLINTGTALALDVVGCLLLIPWLGIEGAALAWAVAIVARNLLGLVQVARHLHLTPFNSTTAGLAVVCVGLFGVIPAAVNAFTHRTSTALFAVACVLLVYGGVLWKKSAVLALGELRHRRPRTVP